ncbi:33K [Duck adenovirus 3]|nr:33K [Duck adenovirus 3]
MTQKQVDAMKEQEQRELDRSREEDDWESIGSEDTYSEVSDEEDVDLEGFITSSEDQPPPSPKRDATPKQQQKKRKLTAPPPTPNPKQKKARSAPAAVTEKTSKAAAAVRSLVKRARPSPRKVVIPDPEEVIALRSDILKTLLEIDSYAKEHPSQKIAIRNRTRESITRHLHYEKSEEKLTRMKTDAAKLLDLWKAV